MHLPAGRGLFSNAIQDCFGFQGQEKDDEIKGPGNSLNYEYRMHGPRLGRFFAIDPLTSDYPWNSPYAFSENVVINAVELEGLEKKNIFIYNSETKSFPKDPDEKEVDENLTKNINVYIYPYPNGGAKRTVVKSWDKQIVFEVQGSAIDAIQRMLYSHSISAPKSADKTLPMTWEGGANGADGQTKQTKKDIAVGGAVVAIIATPFTAGRSLSFIEWSLLTTSTASNIDDLGTNYKGESTLQQMFPNQQGVIGKVKFGLSAISVRSGSINLLKTNTESAGSFLPTLVSTAIDINSVRNGLESSPQNNNVSTSDVKFDLQTKDNTNIVLPKIRL